MTYKIKKKLKQGRLLPTADNSEIEATVMDYETICAKIKSARKSDYTQAEVATLCHLSKKTIYKLEQAGKLRYDGWGGRAISWL